MRKKFLGLLTLFLSLSLVACGGAGDKDKSKDGSGDSTPVVVTRYTVKFENDGQRVATESVKAGEKLAANQIPTVAAPEGKEFVGWADANGEIVDLTTYVVNGDVTFTAVFKDSEGGGEDGDVLSVDDVKETGKEYYLVFGWWEVNDPDDPTKVTSSLTKENVRLFYGNMIKYLKLKTPAATDAEIANIQFRNYSTKTVAEMGEKINADGDVDILIGVGSNIQTQGNVEYFDRFQTIMGTKSLSRYVVAPAVASDLGKETFAWLKDTDVGKDAFLKELTDDEILASFAPVVINLTVTVHGDTDAVTTLEDKDTAIEMPTITAPEGKIFKGFATASDGEVVLNVAKDASLKYDNLKDLVAEGANTLDLYPVFEDAPVVEEDLVVYIQISGSNLTLPEAKLLEARFNETLTTEVVKFNFIEGNAATFSGAIGDDSDVIIGGNNPVNNLGKHADGATANAGAKHFADKSRKVIISDKCSNEHLELAKKLYKFVIADAPEFEFHYTFWSNANKWTTEEERTTMTAAIEANVKTYLGVGDEETLADKYNVVITTYLATNTKVADLGTETLGLRDGKGTDLVIGCGNNIDATEGTTAGMTTVAKKAIGSPFVAASGRYVALIRENPLARNVYDTYFVTESTGE